MDHEPMIGESVFIIITRPKNVKKILSLKIWGNISCVLTMTDND